MREPVPIGDHKDRGASQAKEHCEVDDDERSSRYRLLRTIHSPSDVKALDHAACEQLAREIREFIVDTVTRTSGHLGSNLGIVETTIALHRVFDSPRDVLLFDTGHQAYVHKLLTGRMDRFEQLRSEGGLSGYPNRAESEHDWIENSHASTALSYAHGVALGFSARGEDDRRVVAVVGDGALTGGMAYEALNNLGHSSMRVLIILNDNGRSYAPTISKLSESLTHLRLSPSYGTLRDHVGQAISELPGIGPIAGASLRSLTSAMRELVEPQVFFEPLGIRYAGPIDGHDVAGLERALQRAAGFKGPLVLHVLTTKGKGYAPAEQDEVQCLHDVKPVASQVAAPGTGRDHGSVTVGPKSPEKSYTEAFSKALVTAAERDERVVAITAAMPGPTGLLPFEQRFPKRFIDVGIAEQHAMTAAAGMAMSGLRPVVAVYSTFLSRAFDQQNLDVGLHRAPVVICADRAGVTGDDGPSHHGLLDMALGLSIPGLTVFAPSEPSEIASMLDAALGIDGPSLIRYPKTPGPRHLGEPGNGLAPRVLRSFGRDAVLVGIGSLAKASVEACDLLAELGIRTTVVDPRVVRPLHEDLIELLVTAELVITAEDGFTHGGAGQFLRSEIERLAIEQSVVGPQFVCLGVPTDYLMHAKPEAILHRLGLDAEGIAASTERALERLEMSGLSPAHLGAVRGARR